MATRSLANTWPVPAACTITANGFFSASVSASACCAASSGPVGVTTSNSIFRPQVLKLCANTSLQSRYASSVYAFWPVAWSFGGDWPMVFHAASCCSCVLMNSTTLMESLSTPIVVAPPLLSPFFNGRVHGARCWYGYASLPSGPQFGESSAAFVPTPAAGTVGPTCGLAPATDVIAATRANATARTNVVRNPRRLRRGRSGTLMNPPQILCNGSEAARL